MGDPVNRHTDRKLWADGLDEALINMMYEDISARRAELGKFGQKNYNMYVKQLNHFGSKIFSTEQVNEKIKRLKKRQYMFIELLGQPGMKWDNSSKSVIAIDEYWEKAISVNKDWNFFRNVEYSFCSKLCEIFGMLAPIDTTQIPAGKQVEGGGEERHLGAEVQSPTDISMITPSSGPSTRKRDKGVVEASASKRSKPSTSKMNIDEGGERFSRCVGNEVQSAGE
ncbi:uncharacterized protein LOC118349459 [Juglans regia]|uniref:Uncharacterized protein LOC118349459 n=1 Tax=Juglans regia TaxID=51240 RepID=A0A6P9EQW9_JUGRE|nr:uncharacterized protein LOC118349459 [Juglans regia]